MEEYQPVGMQNIDAKSELSVTKRKLVDAGIKLIRERGYNATTVEDICSHAGVTKGGFFHYFKSKEDIAKAALTRFGEEKYQAFKAAPFVQQIDALDRVYGRLNFAKASSTGAGSSTKGCLIGVIAQELAFTHPELRRACQDLFLRTAREFEKDLTEAKAIHAPKADFDPQKVAMLYVSIIQGSLMLAKAAETNTVLEENIELFRRHLQALFG
jgi:TetR/AcrR family transcriptional repressor of nem operon